MTRLRPLVALAFALASCALSREGVAVDHECETDADCPGDTACIHPGEGRPSQCRPICDWDRGSLCDDGSICLAPLYMEERGDAICWAGEGIGLGEPCNSHFVCRHGLLCNGARTCIMACNTTSDCPWGEYCVAHSVCVPRCDARDASSCPDAFVCVEGACREQRLSDHCGAESLACDANFVCDYSEQARGACVVAWEYGCTGAGCPEGEQCVDGCVPAHE